MSLTYQKLGPGDGARMRDLNDLFGRAFGDEATYTGAPPRPDYLERLLGSDMFHALVAMDGDQVVGGIAAYELPKFERERSEIYLYDLAVAPTHRRRGVATGLIRRLQAVAHQRGAYVLFVQADAGDEPALRLYEKLGTKEEVFHFDLEPKSEEDSASPQSDSGPGSSPIEPRQGSGG